MKLHAEVESQLRIRAILREDGTMDLRATATAPYAEGATACAVLDVPAAEAGAVRQALQAALMAAAQKAAPRMLDALSLTRNVARAAGEIP